MAITTDELRILLKVNGASTYTHTINEVTNVTNNYNKSCMNLMSTLAKLVSGAAIVRFGKQCIEAASNLQEVANVVDVTFGQNADKVNKWAKTQAANFGLSETAAKRYIGTYGTMAKQFDMTSSQAASMGIELTKLTGDVASFYNLEDKVAATKLKAIFTGETEGLKELGVVMTETQLNAYAMTKGLGKTTKEMSEQEKVLLRYNYTMEKLAHAQGDFARTSDGYANSVRGLKLQLENMKVEIGNELIPVAAMGIQAISKGLNTIAPVLISIARTVRLYAEAWKNASAETKAFAKIAFSTVAIMIVAPKVIAMVSAAVKLLTMDITTLGMAMNALLGIVGVIFAVAAIAGLSKNIEDIGTSAEVSSVAVDDLSDSMQNLGQSTNDLNTFLASFDEVNKVSGGGSLMSSLVNSEDLANILGAASGIGNLNDEIAGVSDAISKFGANQLFTKEWWDKKKEFFKGWWTYLKESFMDGSWKTNFMSMLESLDRKIEELFPKWHNYFQQIAYNIYDTLNADGSKAEKAGNKLLGMSSSETFTFTDDNGNRRSVLKYDSSGATSALWNKYGSRAWENGGSRTATASNNPIQVNSTIQLDGRTIATVVQEYQNKKTRSSGYSAALG